MEILDRRQLARLLIDHDTDTQVSVSVLIEVLHNFGFGMLHFDTSNPHSATSRHSSSRAVRCSFWQVLRSYKQLFEHFRAVRKNKKMRHEFEECGLESKFDHLHDLLCEHDIEEDRSSFDIQNTPRDGPFRLKKSCDQVILGPTVFLHSFGNDDRPWIV